MKKTIFILWAVCLVLACEKKESEKSTVSKGAEMGETVEEVNLWPNHEPVSALTDTIHQQNVEVDEIKNQILAVLKELEPWHKKMRAGKIKYNPNRESDLWFISDDEVVPFMKNTVLVNLSKDSSKILTASYKKKILKRGELLNEPFNLTLLMTGNKSSAELNGYFDIMDHSSIFMTLAGRGDELDKYPQFEGDDTPAPSLPKEQEVEIYKQMIKINETGKTATHIIPYKYLKEYVSGELEDDYVVFQFVNQAGNWLVDDIYIAPASASL